VKKKEGGRKKEGSVDLFINSEGLACNNTTIQDYKFAGGGGRRKEEGGGRRKEERGKRKEERRKEERREGREGPPDFFQRLLERSFWTPSWTTRAFA
jgi:hypothetical protein